MGLIADWLTGKIIGSPGKGSLMDIIIGLVGALPMTLLGFRSEGGLIYTILVAVLWPCSSPGFTSTREKRHLGRPVGQRQSEWGSPVKAFIESPDLEGT